jgi:hypothetical protein
MFVRAMRANVAAFFHIDAHTSALGREPGREQSRTDTTPFVPLLALATAGMPKQVY